MRDGCGVAHSSGHREYCKAQARHKAGSNLLERIITMINQLITALGNAFTQVVNLVGGGLDGVFGAVGNLSSNIF